MAFDLFVKRRGVGFFWQRWKLRICLQFCSVLFVYNGAAFDLLAMVRRLIFFGNGTALDCFILAPRLIDLQWRDV